MADKHNKKEQKTGLLAYEYDEAEQQQQQQQQQQQGSGEESFADALIINAADAASPPVSPPLAASAPSHAAASPSVEAACGVATVPSVTGGARLPTEVLDAVGAVQGRLDRLEAKLDAQFSQLSQLVTTAVTTLRSHESSLTHLSRAVDDTRALASSLVEQERTRNAALLRVGSEEREREERERQERERQEREERERARVAMEEQERRAAELRAEEEARLAHAQRLQELQLQQLQQQQQQQQGRSTAQHHNGMQPQQTQQQQQQQHPVHIQQQQTAPAPAQHTPQVHAAPAAAAATPMMLQFDEKLISDAMDMGFTRDQVVTGLTQLHNSGRPANDMNVLLDHLVNTI